MGTEDVMPTPPFTCEFVSFAQHCVLSVALPVGSRHHWTPETPFLYNFSVQLLLHTRDAISGARTATLLDTVGSYTALRTIGTLQSLHPVYNPQTPPSHSALQKPVTQVRSLTRLALNGLPRYLIGTLDQGFWPESAYASPTDEALYSDLLTLKSLGFDAIRKHQKVESRRFYFHCDRLGIAVIQDFPGGRGGFGNATVDAQFRLELSHMVRRVAAHPSVIAYSIYNEGGPGAWNKSGGEHYIAGIVEYLAETDRSTGAGGERLIDAASGWHQSDAGSILSSHSYPMASMPNCSSPGIANLSGASASRGHYALTHCEQRVLINSEFGGLCLAPSAIGLPEWFDHGHSRFFTPNYKCAGWGPTRRNPTNCTRASANCTCSHGYGTGAVKHSGNDRHAVSALYANITSRIAAVLIPSGVSASIYTQTSDVETEADGILSYDRVMKVVPAIVLQANTAVKTAAARYFASISWSQN